MDERVKRQEETEERRTALPAADKPADPKKDPEPGSGGIGSEGRGVGAGGVSAIGAKTASDAYESTSLFSDEEAKDFRSRWEAVQVSFVDDPRQSVKRADGLVAEATKRLAEMFAEERAKLEGEWNRGGDVSTEELRILLRRYRSFFGRLLSL